MKNRIFLFYISIIDLLVSLGASILIFMSIIDCLKGTRPKELSHYKTYQARALLFEVLINGNPRYWVRLLYS